VCAKCGARIRADREWCLRCEAPLVPARSRSSELQLPAWLRARGGGTLIFGAVGVLAVLLVGYTIWDRSASSNGDAGARPATAPAGGGSSTGAAAPSVTLWSATSLDAKKKGGAEPSGAELVRFSRAAQLGPRNWAYHFNLAYALGQRQNWDRATSEYRIAAGLYATDAATQCNLATALQKKGDDAAAIPVFEKAVQLAPAEPSCDLALATSLEKEGRDADARREYQQDLDLAPSAHDADSVKSRLASLGAGRS